MTFCFRPALLFSLCSIFILPQAFAGVDPTEMVINFQDSNTESSKILVVKRDNVRAFYQCPVADGQILKPKCTLINTFNVQSFELDKNKLNDGKLLSLQSGWRWGLTVPAAIFGIFPGALMAIVSKKGAWNTGQGGSTWAFIITEGAITVTAYAIGSWFDGKHFTPLETSAISGTIGRPEILNADTNSELQIPVSVAEYRNLLEIAGRTLNSH